MTKTLIRRDTFQAQATLRPAEEVAIGMARWCGRDGELDYGEVSELIHADRIATARRVLEGLADTIIDRRKRGIGVGGLREFANNPTALEALLMKETK